jgi:hypothetical protein
MQRKNMISEINKLRQMTVGELREKWLELYGEPSRSRNKDYLWRRLAWRIQELQYGGLSDRARARIEELAPDGFIRARPPTQAIPARPTANVARIRDARRPTPGTIITRQWHDRELRLLILEDAFEFDGVQYGSLSEAARAATGQRWSGPLFWGLKKRSRKS